MKATRLILAKLRIGGKTKKKTTTTALRLVAGAVVCLLLQFAHFNQNVGYAEEVATEPPKSKVIFEMPHVKRTEGRITLEYKTKSGEMKQELAFSEVVDTETRRSKTSIGFVAYPKSVYYARGETVLTLNKVTGRCEKLDSDSSLAPPFVPELKWLLDKTYTPEELRASLPESRGHHVGPTGLALALFKRKFEFNRKEKYRNVACQVSVAHTSRAKVKYVLTEIYTPSLKLFDERRMNLFTLRESALEVDDGQGGTFDSIITIDYYFTEKINKKDPHQLDRLEMDLNMPMGLGCSELLRPYKLQVGYQSFMMTFEEMRAPTSGLLTSLAYDHQFNYLRLERVGDSVGIWDLNEDLLYHQDQQGLEASRLVNAVDVEVQVEQCSVLSVESGSGGGKRGEDDASDESEEFENKLVKPYKVRGNSLKLLEFLGGEAIVYMGKSSVRDLPASVFETVLEEPPRVFQMDIAHAASSANAKDKFDFIVQYYIFKTSSKHTGSMEAAGGDISAIMLDYNFWPARINLMARNKLTGKVELENSLEIHDFHWGLFGWNLKPSQLFMLPACFNDEDEQVRIQLALEFKQPKPQLTTPAKAAEDNRKLLVKSKYKLEWDLMNDVFQTLELSRLHMTAYEFHLTASRQSPSASSFSFPQVLASFVVSDRLEDKRVSYFGEGELPQADSYLNERIELQGGRQNTVQSCLMAAAHIKDISLVIHCPGLSAIGSNSAGRPEPTCTAIFGETQPVIKKKSSSGMADGSGVKSCQVYRFETRDPPKSGLASVKRFSDYLRNYEFNFETLGGALVGAAAPNGHKTLSGRVVDFEVTRQQQLITINNYHFALRESTGGTGGASDAKRPPTADQLVRYFDSVAQETASDCSRICSLDSACRSYSFCRRLSADATTTNKTSASEKRCLLSSLDLRANKVDDQLVLARPNGDNQISVRETQRAAGATSDQLYLLEMKSGCDIYERDILSMFTLAEESLRVDRHLADRLPPASSASECARRVLALESKPNAGYLGAAFAYCPQTETCLADENLFDRMGKDSSSRGNATSNQNDNDDDEERAGELACEMYRKRYQSYFHISAKVVRRIGGADGETSAIKHIDLALGTVEECARACWQTYGHVCLSFDFCTTANTQACTINSLMAAAEAGDLPPNKSFDESAIEYETRPGCLGYKRDLRWDHLRRQHLIGSQNLLLNGTVQMHANSASSLAHHWGGFAGMFTNFLLLCATAVLFLFGLVVGRVFNDRLELASSTRRTSGGGPSSLRVGFASFLPSGSGANSSLFPGGGGGALDGRRGPGDRLSTNSKFNIENEIYEDPDAIRLEDFGGKGAGGTNGTTADEELNGESNSLSARYETLNGSGNNDGSSSSSSSKQPTDRERRAGHIDVPDLMQV